jgi:hypothetical protein
MSDTTDDIEFLSGAFDSDEDFVEDRIIEVLKYCQPHLDKMWAAKICSILLDVDFRDTQSAVKEYLEEIED